VVYVRTAPDERVMRTTLRGAWIRELLEYGAHVIFVVG
jgi:hypothetical protein